MLAKTFRKLKNFLICGQAKVLFEFHSFVCEIQLNLRIMHAALHSTRRTFRLAKYPFPMHDSMLNANSAPAQKVRRVDCKQIIKKAPSQQATKDEAGTGSWI